MSKEVNHTRLLNEINLSRLEGNKYSINNIRYGVKTVLEISLDLMLTEDLIIDAINNSNKESNVIYTKIPLLLLFNNSNWDEFKIYNLIKDIEYSNKNSKHKILFLIKESGEQIELSLGSIIDSLIELIKEYLNECLKFIELYYIVYYKDGDIVILLNKTKDKYLGSEVSNSNYMTNNKMQKQEQNIKKHESKQVSSNIIYAITICFCIIIFIAIMFC